MIFQSIAGLIVFAAVAWAISENRGRVSIKTVIVGIVIQLAVGIILLKVPAFRNLFNSLNSVVSALQESTLAGTSFVFGYIGGGTLPFDEKFPGASFILAIQALPLVLVMSALSGCSSTGRFCLL